MECSTGDTMTAKERDKLMKKVKPLENKLGNNKKCTGKNNKKQKKCTKRTVEVDRMRTALDNRSAGRASSRRARNGARRRRAGMQALLGRVFVNSTSVTTCAPSRERYHILHLQ